MALEVVQSHSYQQRVNKAIQSFFLHHTSPLKLQVWVPSPHFYVLWLYQKWKECIKYQNRQAACGRNWRGSLRKCSHVILVIMLLWLSFWIAVVIGRKIQPWILTLVVSRLKHDSYNFHLKYFIGCSFDRRWLCDRRYCFTGTQELSDHIYVNLEAGWQLLSCTSHYSFHNSFVTPYTNDLHLLDEYLALPGIASLVPSKSFC